MNTNQFQKEQENYNFEINLPENKLKEKFFSIWITKSIMSKGYGLFELTKSFLDDDKFSEKKYQDFLDFLIQNRVFSSQEGVMSINYKNTNTLDEDTIIDIMTQESDEFFDETIFSEELGLYLESIGSEPIKMFGKETFLFRSEIDSKEERVINNGLKKYLDGLYKKALVNADIEGDINNFVKRVIEILKK